MIQYLMKNINEIYEIQKFVHVKEKKKNVKVKEIIKRSK